MKAARQIRAFVRLAKGHLAYGGRRQLGRLLQGYCELSLGGSFFDGRSHSERYCPCCEWSGRRFRPYIAAGYTSLDAVCPKCNSHARHRGHLLYYRADLDLLEKKGRLLYFAPERGILPHLRGASGLAVETADYRDVPGMDHRYDVTNLDVEDDAFDYIICHRVIEHVRDDRKASEELYRVLKPGGLAIISVPISWNRDVTIEFGEPNPLCDGHYYDYGLDFQNRMTHEFEVTERRFSRLFDAQTFRRLALCEDSIFECRKRRPR